MPIYKIYWKKLYEYFFRIKFYIWICIFKYEKKKIELYNSVPFLIDASVEISVPLLALKSLRIFQWLT